MPDVDARSRGYSELEQPRGRKLARLAFKQHGTVGTWQLHRLGYDKDAIRRLVAAGVLHRLSRGVYAVGHMRLTRKGRWMAAVLACGPNAVLSHRSAAGLHEVRPVPSGPIDVTVPGRSHHSRKGIRVHNVRTLDPRDVTIVDGIPVTTLARTLLDYAEVSGKQWTRVALEESERRDKLDLRELRATIARNPGRHGIKQLNAVLAEWKGFAPWTQSEKEKRMLVILRSGGFPEPQTGALLDGELVDFYWPQLRLVAEVDPFWTHKTRASFRKDRQRSNKLQLAGLTILRFTEEDVDDQPQAVLAELWAVANAAAAA